MNQDNSHNNRASYIKDYNRGGAWAYAVVLETEVESRLASDYRFYRGDGTADFSNALNEFINSAYFKKNNLRVYNPVPWNFKDDPLLTNILSASKVKLICKPVRFLKVQILFIMFNVFGFIKIK